MNEWISFQVEGKEYQGTMLKLQAAIKYGEEDLAGAKSLVDQCPADAPDTDMNLACLLYKEGRYQEALVKFQVKFQNLFTSSMLSRHV